ncbi:hypothetical protein EW146_g7304 [Bondarzewia mesenterica]|uniref:Peptidase S53 domain-containing protein n=1 Tax=Bondarzewia mesenterica TaxID=1095465 RepID=A0A4S4LLA8_9AGAM|nr:hypothetical protein EW146_g7304 [Bondarzewia mesenterica]
MYVRFAFLPCSTSYVTHEEPRSGELSTMYLFFELGFDTLIFILSMSRTIYVYYKHQGTGAINGHGSSLMANLMRDGIFYFAVTTTMICRITLNLRTTVYGPVDAFEKTENNIPLSPLRTRRTDRVANISRSMSLSRSTGMPSRYLRVDSEAQRWREVLRSPHEEDFEEEEPDKSIQVQVQTETFQDGSVHACAWYLVPKDTRLLLLLSRLSSRTIATVSVKFALLASSIALVAAGPSPRMRIHEKRENVPNGFVKTAAAPASEFLSLRLALVQSYPQGLGDALYAVSTPNSPQYGQFLSKEEGHLDFVRPTVNFSVGPSQKPLTAIPIPKTIVKGFNLMSNGVPSSCSSNINPSCFQAMYDIPTTLATESSNELAVTGYIDQYPSKASPFLHVVYWFVNHIWFARANPGVEAVSADQPTFSAHDRWCLLAVNYMLGLSTVPNVMTTSYGSDESDVSVSLANNLCNAYDQLGARGTSVFFSSGDGGVSGSQSGSCSTFVPIFPPGYPHVTSVGATTGFPETTANFSSDGFSDYWGRPIPPDLRTLGVTSPRSAAPTVACSTHPAAGENVQIVTSGSTQSVAGTSCSSLIFASTIALINDQLVAAGKSPLGFLNLFLYSTAASALNDITTTRHFGDRGLTCYIFGQVTGLGTPNYAALKLAAGW